MSASSPATIARSYEWNDDMRSEMTMPMDLGGADGGKLAGAFAAGCAATWVFIKAFVQAPIVKLYEARIKALEDENQQCRKDMNEVKDRVRDLETLLTANGFGPLRQQTQRAISEGRVSRDLEERK